MTEGLSPYIKKLFLCVLNLRSTGKWTLGAIPLQGCTAPKEPIDTVCNINGTLWGFLCGSAGKESACNAGDPGTIPGLGRFPGERNGYPLLNSF